MDFRIVGENVNDILNLLDENVETVKIGEVISKNENILYISKSYQIYSNGYNRVMSLHFPKYDVHFSRFTTRKLNLEEIEYLKMLHDVITTGELRETRNGKVYSKFHGNLSFDLSTGFPLLTTKKVFFRGVLEETLFFLRGQTNTQILSDKGVKIWESNTSREFLDKSGLTNLDERDMGPMYGFQFYHFGTKYDNSDLQGFNQFEYIINLIKTDKFSRRIIMTSFNPSQAMQGCLYPCHSLVLQFYVDRVPSGVEGISSTSVILKGDKCVEEYRLSMICYNRSQDLFLGTPWNVAYAALIIHIVCSYINSDPTVNFKLSPGKLHLDMGDIHVYEPHVNSCIKQISRLPYKFPKLTVTSSPNVMKTFMDYTTSLNIQDFNLTEYEFHPAIKEDMIA